MAINLSTVRISLDRFDAVSDGEFNIGHIKLSKDGSDIVRTNRHKTFEFLNKDTIPPEETLAIKDAFCRALSQERLSADIRDDYNIVNNTNLMSQMVKAKLPSIPEQNNGRYDDVVTVGSKKVGASFKGKAYVGSRVLHLTEGYFRRNIMSAIAKPGWFDEVWREE